MNSTQNIPQPENKLSEELFQIIFTQAGDGIFLIDEDGIILEANPRGCEILGYARDEVCGNHVLKFQPPDEIEHIQKQLAQLAIEKLVTTESVFIRKDGARVPVEITGKLLSNNQIIGLLRDITERKQTEQALIESEQKFRSLVEHSPDGIIVVDEHGRVVEWNRGQENITGLKQSQVLGRLIWDIQAQLMPEEYGSQAGIEGLKNRMLEILHTGHGLGLNIPLEARIKLPDGTFRNVELVMYSYKSKLGYRVGSIARDITKRKQVEMLLEYLAMHDALTDLPNRQLFEDRLKHAIDRARRDRGRTLTVMMLDLDHFKEVNDTRGHAYGDQLLKIVGQRLQGCLRKSDTAARMSGDEFAIIAESVTDLEAIQSIAHKVLQSIEQPMEIEGHSFQLTVSIGITVYSSNIDDVTALLRQADMAMYEAKRTRNCYRFYSTA